MALLRLANMIFNNAINYNKPDCIVQLKNLVDPSDVYSYCRSHNIRHYCYGIRFVVNSYKYFQLKFGSSAPNGIASNKHQKGERLVRQISWIPGWNADPCSSHGYEFWHGCTKLINRGNLPSDLTYKDFEVAIWVMNWNSLVSEFSHLTNREQVNWSEGELCSQYAAQNDGYLPILNKNDPRNTKDYQQPVKDLAYSKWFTET